MSTRDGRRLHAMVLSGPQAGAPTVVFEAGAAATRSSWSLVQPLVGAWTSAVVYDRSGLGRSAADPHSRTLRRMADDLGQVLDDFGPGPFVLVGHSAGGPIVRAAAAASPGRVAGLVLVDSTDEAADVLFSRAFRRMERIAIATNLALARARLLRPLYRPLYRSVVKPLPPEAREDMRHDGLTLEVVQTQACQARTFLDELAAFRKAPPDLAALAATVISGRRSGTGMNAAIRAAANAAHARRAAQTPRGRHVIAQRSGHYVPITEPRLVADEIHRLIESFTAP